MGLRQPSSERTCKPQCRQEAAKSSRNSSSNKKSKQFISRNSSKEFKQFSSRNINKKSKQFSRNSCNNNKLWHPNMESRALNPEAFLEAFMMCATAASPKKLCS